MLANMNRLAEILKEEVAKVADTGEGKYSRKLARTKWRADLGDTFRYRGQTFKGGSSVASFRTWRKSQAT